MDNEFVRQHRRHTRELNVVPILDLMTTLIVFLLQITSFMELTKITVPPSTTKTVTEPSRPPPMTPRILLMHKASQKGYRIQLTWTGAKPGAKQAIFKQGEPVDNDIDSVQIIKLTKKIVEEFRKINPTESTFQVGIGGQIPYQHLVALMDGIQAGFGNLEPLRPLQPQQPAQTQAPTTPAALPPVLANIILVSYAEVDAEVNRSGSEL